MSNGKTVSRRPEPGAASLEDVAFEKLTTVVGRHRREPGVLT
jgi:hypothetical protein